LQVDSQSLDISNRSEDHKVITEACPLPGGIFGPPGVGRSLANPKIRRYRDRSGGTAGLGEGITLFAALLNRTRLHLGGHIGGADVNTRVNPPADYEIGSATRDSLAGTLSFTPGVISSTFTANNSVVNGINQKPNQFTGGKGAVTGQEVQFNVIFTTPIVLTADHYFFRPEVGLSGGDFLWLSAPKPITSGTPFLGDLQTWIRNSDLKPDWSRIGTDITHQGPFNASFSLAGGVVPEPYSVLLLATGIAGLAAWRMRRWMPRKTV
jgi:hypothetical protein